MENLNCYWQIAGSLVSTNGDWILSGGGRGRHHCFVSFTSWSLLGSLGEDQKRILCCFWQRHGESSHSEVYPEPSVLKEACLSAKETYQNLIDLGEGKYSTPALSSLPVLSEGSEGRLRSTWEGPEVQAYSKTETWSQDYRNASLRPYLRRNL